MWNISYQVNKGLILSPRQILKLQMALDSEKYDFNVELYAMISEVFICLMSTPINYLKE